MSGTFLVVQWLSLSLPTQGAWVRSLVRELDPTCHNEDVVQANKLKNKTHTHTHTHSRVYNFQSAACPRVGLGTCSVLRERRRPWPQASTGTQRDTDPDRPGPHPSPTTYYTGVALGKVCPRVPISAPVEVGVTPRRTAVRTEVAHVSETEQ